MSETKSFDLGFFPAEIGFWYDTSSALYHQWSDLVGVPKLPEVNPLLDPRLTALIPVLNEAKTDVCLNISRGFQASRRFAESLIEAGRNYGLTAEEAEALARDWNDR